MTAPAVDTAKLVADLAYVEERIAASTVLQATIHRVYSHGQQVSVEVEGAHWEARAWRAAFGGRIYPSHYDVHAVRHQLVVAARVEIEVVQHPRHGDAGRINAALAIIVAGVGLFLWGWSHSNSRPDGAWIAAVAVIGAVVLLLATGAVTYRRRERADAAYTAEMEKRLNQDTTGDHYLDGV